MRIQDIALLLALLSGAVVGFIAGVEWGPGISTPPTPTVCACDEVDGVWEAAAVACLRVSEKLERRLQQCCAGKEER